MVGLSWLWISCKIVFTLVMWSMKLGWLMSTTCNSTSASRTSSKVDLKLSTNCVGNFLIKPTVSVNSKGKLSMLILRTVVSKVAKSLFSANTSVLHNKFSRVLFPTFVYPTRAIRQSLPLLLRWVVICTSIFCSFFLSKEIFCWMIRRSVSIWVSPGPRIPIPPFCRSKWVHIRVSRGSKYWYWANSTCVRA